jgi:hypothetical protein
MVAEILFAIGNVAAFIAKRCGKKIAVDSRNQLQKK